MSENAFGDAFIGLYALGRLFSGLRTVQTVTLVDIVPPSKRTRRAPARERELTPGDLMRNASLLARAASNDPHQDGGVPPGAGSAADASGGLLASPRPTLTRQASVASNSPAAALQRLARGLMHVKVLDLSCVNGRPLGDESIALLGYLVAHSKSLRHLDVSGQQITDVGLSAISHGLLQTQTLQHVAFDNSGASLPALQVRTQASRRAFTRVC